MITDGESSHEAHLEAEVRKLRKQLEFFDRLMTAGEAKIWIPNKGQLTLIVAFRSQADGQLKQPSPVLLAKVLEAIRG